MRVDDVMSRDVLTCRADDTCDRAAGIMRDRDCGCVPVVSDDNHVIGMITDRDICMAACERGRPLAEIPVGRVMSPEVFTCSLGDTVEDAERIMRRGQVRRLPVVGFQGQLVGVLSLADLARAARGDAPSVEAVETTLAAVTAERHPHLTSPR